MTTEKTDQITTELAKINVTKTVLVKLKTDYLPLKIKGVEDKEGYKKVHDARIDCRDLRVKTEKACKLGWDEAIKVQKQWITKEKEIVAEISEVEQYLKKQEDDIDSQIEAQKIRAERLLKLPGRKEQVVGIEGYVLNVFKSMEYIMNTEWRGTSAVGISEEITDELIMKYDDVQWNQIILLAKDKKITEFEEKERTRKNQERQEILANRTNLLMLAGAQIRIINGVRTFVKGNHHVQEDRIIELHPEAFEFERDIFEKAEIPDAPPGIKEYPKTPSESYKAPTQESTNGREYSDEEKLFKFALEVENFKPPIMRTEAGKKVLGEAMELITKAIWILRQ